MAKKTYYAQWDFAYNGLHYKPGEEMSLEPADAKPFLGGVLSETPLATPETSSESTGDVIGEYVAELETEKAALEKANKKLETEKAALEKKLAELQKPTT
jgi:hypothetical protein